MFKFFLIFNILILITTAYASEENGKKFIRQLLKWNIDFLKLENFKAGAGCMTPNNQEYDALGLSYNLADIEYAKKIALQGCEQMKKKNKILTECKCEIIYVNNNLVIKE
tara:strand:+ start:23 stop:352 length:330 start_codon:yes stop_codon:yes gene_type:complete